MAGMGMSRSHEGRSRNCSQAAFSNPGATLAKAKIGTGKRLSNAEKKPENRKQREKELRKVKRDKRDKTGRWLMTASVASNDATVSKSSQITNSYHEENRVAVVIRMKKFGRKHRPFFRICAMDVRSPRDGRVLEELGTYDPMIPDTDARVMLDHERVKYWLSVGAQPSEKVRVLIKKYGANGTHMAQQQSRPRSWPCRR